MQYKVITKHGSVVHYFETIRRAILFAKEVNGKIYDATNKLLHDYCKEKK